MTIKSPPFDAQDNLTADVATEQSASLTSTMWEKIKYLFSSKRSELIPEALPTIKPYDMEEVKALYRFAVDNAIEVDNEVIKSLGALISKRSSSPKEFSAEDEGDLMASYKLLTNTTYTAHKVNGRTIRDSAKFSEGVVSQAGVWGSLFFALAIVPDALYFMLDQDNPAIYLVTFLVVLSPFFWGGVGSAIFLVKSLSEIAGKSRFDSRRLEGIPARIFLGAALGYIVVAILQSAEWLEASNIIEGGLLQQVSSNAIAFMTGLGTKAVYGILETIIQGISDRLKTK